MQCKAHSKQSGNQCGREATPGAEVCDKHGGKAPAVMAKAKERLLQAKIQGELAQLGWEPVRDPLEWIQDLAGEVSAFHAMARRQMAALTSWESIGELGIAQVSAIVQVYERALDRSVATAEKMIRLGFQAQITAATVLQAKTIADGMRWVIEQARERPDVPADQLILEAIGERK